MVNPRAPSSAKTVFNPGINPKKKKKGKKRQKKKSEKGMEKCGDFLFPLITLVFWVVDLHLALDNVEWCDCQMGLFREKKKKKNK